jgi:hypothetical protein
MCSHEPLGLRHRFELSHTPLPKLWYFHAIALPGCARCDGFICSFYPRGIPPFMQNVAAYLPVNFEGVL